MGSAACGDDDGSSPELDGGSDASSPDGATPDGGIPAHDLEIERWGGRIRGPALALSRIERTLWIGTSVIEDSSAGGALRNGLVRLDLDTGALRIFEEELPPAPSEPGGPLVSEPTAGVIRDGARHIVLAPSGLLVLEGETFTRHALVRSDGERLEPSRAVLDRPASGDARLWVSTHLGLVLVDPDTFAIRHSAFPVSGTAGALAVDPATRDVYVAQLDDGAIARVQYAPEGPITTHWIRPGTDEGVPAGFPGDLVWSSELGAAVIALGSWDPSSGGVITWDGTEVHTIASEGQLALAARGEAIPFGAQVLAIDETDGVLIVGGRIRSRGPASPLEGGGLVWIDLASVGGELEAAGASVARTSIGGDFVSAISYDPDTNRTYAALRQPCNETRLANVGVDVIAWRGRELEVGTAALSGVRDLESHEGALWAALRDDAPGLACEGLGTQGGLFALHAARGGVAPRMIATRGEGELSVWQPARIAPNRLALRDADHRIVASFRDSLYVGGDEGLLINPAIELGVNLRTHDAVWVDDDTFWLAGPAAHDPSDDADIGNAGPRGASRVTLGPRGDVASYEHFVRLTRFAEPMTRTGLPSANVTAVVPDGVATYLISAIERITNVPYDRWEGEPFMPDGMIRAGGVSAIAEDGTITVLDDGTDVPDGRAAALDGEGTLWVLDAQRGLLRRDGDAFVAAPMSGIAVPAGSIPTGLAIGEDWMVATYSTGAAVRLRDEIAWLDGVGWTWTAMERAPGVLLIGSDEGLLRVRTEDATDPGEPAPIASDLPPYAPLPAPR